MDVLGAYEALNQQVQQNNAWSAQEAQKVRDWQEGLSNTAHQREVQDLKAAGLNPILSAHGNGASVPSGAQASIDNNNTAFLASVLKDVIASNTAIGVANAKAAGGAYDAGYTGNRKKEVAGNNDDDKDDDKDNNWTPRGNYSFDMQGLQNFLGDTFYAITGMTPREAWTKTAGTAKDHVVRYPTYAEFEKNYDGSQPAVTTANGNTEYGAKPYGTVLQWIMNPITNVAKALKPKQSGNPPMTSDPQHKYGYWVDSEGRQYDSYRHGTHWVSK